MSKFTLKNIEPQDFNIRTIVPKSSNKTKTDIFNPGKKSHTTSSGGSVRLVFRGKACNLTGNPYENNCGQPCWWHRYQFDGLAMGIPVKITNDTVYMDGIFCSYSCAYAYLLDELKKMPGEQDPNYRNSKVLIHQLFEQEFPNEKLVAANDWRLIRNVGNGSMSIKEFLNGLKGFRIIKHPNLIFSEVTISYDLIAK